MQNLQDRACAVRGGKGQHTRQAAEGASGKDRQVLHAFLADDREGLLDETQGCAVFRRSASAGNFLRWTTESHHSGSQQFLQCLRIHAYRQVVIADDVRYGTRRGLPVEAGQIESAVCFGIQAHEGKGRQTAFLAGARNGVQGRFQCILLDCDHVPSRLPLSRLWLPDRQLLVRHQPADLLQPRRLQKVGSRR